MSCTITRILLLIIIGVAPYSLLYSQSYLQLIEANKLFEVGTYDQGHICYYSNNTPPRRHFFSGDTIINSKTYSKIYAFDMYPALGVPPPYCPPFEVEDVSTQQPFFIREDTVLQKVYRCCTGIGNDEELLYDFSLQQGDTLLSSLIIDTIVTIVTLDGQTRKKFYITKYPDDGSHYVEGLGGNRGPFIPPVPNFEGQNFTMCVRYNGSIIYGDYCSDITGIGSSYLEKGSLKIYPNPVRDNLKVKTSDSNIKHIRLYSGWGKKLRTDYVEANEIDIDFSNYASGLYLIQVSDDEGALIGTKQIVKY